MELEEYVSDGTPAAPPSAPVAWAFPAAPQGQALAVAAASAAPNGAVTTNSMAHGVRGQPLQSAFRAARAAPGRAGAAGPVGGPVAGLPPTGPQRASGRPPLARQPPQYLPAAATRGLVSLYARIAARAGQAFASTRVRRLLTKRGTPAAPGGADDGDGNLIVHVGDVFVSHRSGRAYVAQELLGAGSFGTVIRCAVDGSGASAAVAAAAPASAAAAPCGSTQHGATVALKVVRNHPAYTSQATLEVRLLAQLWRAAKEREEAERWRWPGGAALSSAASGLQAPPPFDAPVVRLLDHFSHAGHLVLVEEYLPLTLLDCVAMNRYRGLPLPLVRTLTRQLLEAVHFLHSAAICHTDIKVSEGEGVAARQARVWVHGWWARADVLVRSPR
jgi:hypothetical protein